MAAGIGRYRNELKGLAILWIVLFHSDITGGGALGDMARIGYGGVDIFMLLSGFGLCRSLQNNSDTRDYLRRRFKRLAPAYLPFCLIWLCVMLPYFKLPLAQSLKVAVGSLSMTGFLAGAPYITNWYVSLLLVTILIAPMAYAILSRASRPRAALIHMLATAALVSVAFWNSEQLMVFIRLPIFLFGMGLALPSEKARGRAKIAIGAASFVAGCAALWLGFARFPQYLNDTGLYWYPFMLITPPLCAGLAWLFGKAEPIRKVFAPLRFIGTASFEIFLFNAWAEITVQPLGFGDSNVKRLLFALISVAVGCAYHVVVRLITKRVAERRKAADRGGAADASGSGVL